MDVEAGLLRLRDKARVYGHGSRGERCYGIDRLDYPDWPGWEVVDGLKAEATAGTPEFDSLMADDAMLMAWVDKAYHECFGDGLADRGEALAQALLSTCLEMGLKTACELWRRSQDTVRRVPRRADDELIEALLLKDFLLRRIMAYPLADGANLRGLWACVRGTKRLDCSASMNRRCALDAGPLALP